MTDTRDVVILEAARSPIGRGHREQGYYRDVHPADLLAHSYRAVLARTDVTPESVELAIAGCVQQFGEQSMNIARNAWLQEDLPIETSALTLDMQCGSAQQAVHVGAALIASGVHDIVLAGGVEHMGRMSFRAAAEVQAAHGSPITQKFLGRHAVEGQGIGAELIAEAWDITRAEMEELAVASHHRAARATEAGAFTREIAPYAHGEQTYTTDQGIRPDTNPAALARLRPAFKPDGRITAGTSSQVSDGAAAVLLADADTARKAGLRPRALVVDQVSVGCDPIRMLEGPIPATRRILERNGLRIDDIDRIEINEAFASVVLAWERELKPDMDKVNVRGGALALGHPLGSSGARLITTLLHILEDDDAETGLITMCCGGGLGTATLIRRI
jgi:acetyl-CoA acyltransferase